MLARQQRPRDSLRTYARALAEYARDETAVNDEKEARRRFMQDGSFVNVAVPEVGRLAMNSAHDTRIPHFRFIFRLFYIFQ